MKHFLFLMLTAVIVYSGCGTKEEDASAPAMPVIHGKKALPLKAVYDMPFKAA
jgi:hypothetical protein